MKLIIIITISFLSINAFSQDVAAFIDNQKHFIIFDKGETKQIEHLPIKSFKIGGNAVAYVSKTSELKVYYNGVVKTLADFFSSEYYTSKNFVVYRNFKQLYVFDKGKVQLLSSNVKSFSVQDDIISFYDENSKAVKIYFEGKIWGVANSLTGMPVKYFKTGKNTFAYYNDNSKYLMLFMNGSLQKIVHVNGLINFKPGKNILAYIDVAMNTFHVYNKSELFDLEYFKPNKYEVGNNIVAYTDNMGEFKYFYNGEITTLSSFEPNMFKIIDNLLLYTEQSYIKIFYKNKVYEVCDYVPNNYKIQHSTFAYIDLNKKLKAFTKGKLITVTQDYVKSFKIAYDIIIVKTNGNRTQIYYKDKLYK